MATKTISIDLNAYERLKSVQKPAESFSQTIKRVVRRRSTLTHGSPRWIARR
jgi:predicted CopG family antitoxin